MNFTSQPNIYLGISEKRDGHMKYSLANRRRFFKNKNLSDKIIVSVGLVHENKAAIIDDIDQDTEIAGCDALITDQNKYLLTITVADCLPIYFYDINKKVVALAHAGWRGVVSEIVKEVVNLFVSHYNSDLRSIEVFIGPHIQACHFEVKDDVASQFKSASLIVRDKKTYINLSQAVRDQLIKSGISPDNINISPECTACLNDKYFSFRRDNPKELETMVAYIGLRNT